MLNEIGSEFESDSAFAASGSSFLSEIGKDYALTFSGRTAIETALRDAGRAGKAMLPSYCCDSMIEPFRKAGFEIGFYPVSYDGALTMDFEAAADCDVLLFCHYFGFAHAAPPASLCDAVHGRGGIIIEDMTHSLLSAKPVSAQSDYHIASLRKWFPVLSGGICVKKEGSLRRKPQQMPDAEILREKQTAMNMKRKYLGGDRSVSKQEFLHQYGEFNTWLGQHYSGLAMDAESVQCLGHLDIDKIRQRRTENAHALYAGLRGLKGITPLYAEDAMECPLFVPVLIDADRRAAVRQRLTEAAVYCPIHWPRPAQGGGSVLYDTELSLICDQRYTPADMQRIISVLTEAQPQG